MLLQPALRMVVFAVWVCCATLGQTAVATMPVSDARVTGGVEISGSQMRLATGSTVEAGERDALLALSAGGSLKVCLHSAVRLAAGAHAGEMMFSLDHGALELDRALGEFSDVVMTPDLRILLSGPGTAGVKIRANQQGDTCVDNSVAGTNTDAPYVTVTEQLGAGVYRVQAGQRVMFEHGSVSAVVDNEKEPCGCPPPQGAATDFPVAQSEGLAPSPTVTQPAVPAGTAHAQVTVPFVYDGAHPPSASGEASPARAPGPPPAVPVPPPQATPQAPAHSDPDLVTMVKRLVRFIFRRKQAQ